MIMYHCHGYREKLSPWKSPSIYKCLIDGRDGPGWLFTILLVTLHKCFISALKWFTPDVCDHVWRGQNRSQSSCWSQDFTFTGNYGVRAQEAYFVEFLLRFVLQFLGIVKSALRSVAADWFCLWVNWLIGSSASYSSGLSEGVGLWYWNC